MANLAGKDIFTSYRHVPQPFRRMLLARSKSYRTFVEDVRKYQSDASAGEALRLKLTRGTPVLAPADLRLTGVNESPYSSSVVFTGRRYIFTFYGLAFDGLPASPMKAGSTIGTAGDKILHLMVTKRFRDGSSGRAVDAMALIGQAMIRPPFMPPGWIDLKSG